MKKKLLTVILVTTLASMILAGCGNTGSNVKEPATTQEATPTTEATPTEKTEETTESVVTDIPEESTDPVVTDVPDETTEDTTEETTAIESVDRTMNIMDIITELDKLYPIDGSSDRDDIDSSAIDRTHVVEYDNTAISRIFNSTVTDLTPVHIEEGVVNGITFDDETITFIDYFNKVIETVGDPCIYVTRNGYRKYMWPFTDGNYYFIEITIHNEAGDGSIIL